MYNIIRKKRDGFELSREEITKFVKEYTDGKICDYQASALLMAICIKGMTARETSDLTTAMANSGDTVDLSGLGSLSADKHSTGGVGDKTSLIVLPIAAALGCKVAKMSGRGLGHTGGTVDKLESIPGYETAISPEKLIEQTKKVGIALASQSGNLTPADKKIYALRDVTGTVESIPLIASSIMSKKIASGAQNIVLDVKVGSGAFMKSIDDARDLANAMVEIGKASGRNVRAILTNMDIPLGNAVGNSLEVIEAIEILKGNGDKNLLDICCVLAANMASMAVGFDEEKALSLAYESVENGSALLKFREWIEAQGGDGRIVDNYSLLGKASVEKEIKSEISGYITKMDAEKIGNICVDLGGGRKTKEDKIDHTAGIILVKKTGDKVEKGEVIARVYTNKEDVVIKAAEDFLNAIEIADKKPEMQKLIYEVVK
ncbi:MAG: thymidine phosphorylase [Ruminococcaceae bacterium]|nr:thymidine phosphorylase [Oscillospiraceae bacterium]